MTALCVSCDAMRMLQPTRKEIKKGQRKKNNNNKKGQKKLCSFLTLPSVLSRRVWRLQRCEHILFTSATETEMVRGARSWGAVGGSAARGESCPPRETAPAWTRCPSTTGVSPGRPGRSCCWRRAPMAATCCGTARPSRESTASACCECGRPCAAAVASLGCGAAEGGGAGRVVADFQHLHPQYGVFPRNSDKNTSYFYHLQTCVRLLAPSPWLKAEGGVRGVGSFAEQRGAGFALESLCFLRA